MADVYYRVSGQPTATFTSCGPGLGESADQPRQRVLRLGAVLRGNGQRSDQPVQSRCVPGDLPALSGGFSVDGARLLQARVPAHDRSATAGRGASGVEDDGYRASGSGGARRAVRHVQRADTGRNAAARGLERQHFVPLRRRSGRGCQGGRHADGGAAPSHPRRAGRSLRRRERRNCVRLRRNSAYRSPCPRAASAQSTARIRWRSVWSRATARTRRTTPRGRPTCCLRSGVRFDDRTSSSWIPGYSFTIPPTKLIHVDIDPEEIARNYPVALGLMADVRTFLRQLLAEIDARLARGEMPGRARRVAGRHRRLSQGVGGFHRSRLQGGHDTDRAAARGARDRPRASGGHDTRERHRRAPQLAASSSASRSVPIR